MTRNAGVGAAQWRAPEIRDEAEVLLRMAVYAASGVASLALLYYALIYLLTRG